MSTSTDRPYRAALTRAVGATLTAGLVVAAVDGWRTAAAVAGTSLATLVRLSLGLYAWPALLAGLGVGLIAGAAAVSFGPDATGRAIRALRRDRARDVEVTAAIAAGLAIAAVLAVFIAVLALKLVAGVERKSVGALLLGGVAVASVPLFALAALPLQRAARWPARLIPPLGPLPGAVVALVLAAGGALLAAAAVVVARLDWRVLNLGPLIAAGGFAAVAAIAWLAGGALGRRLGGRAGVIVLAASIVAGALPVLLLRGTPDPVDAAALASGSSGAKILVKLGRAARDGDGDGESGFLGGPDCDDGRATVHSHAKEVPGNGIDDNCLGGDASEAAATDPPTPPVDAPSRLKFGGNVVVIAIDTLRADRIGVSGYRRDGKSLTPRIDELIDESVYFSRTWAQAPNTPRSFPSFFSSRYPSMVAVDKSFANYPNPDAANGFLFEALAAAGIATQGQASHFYFDRAPGFVQGFDRFDNAGALDIAGSNKDSAAARIVPRATAALGQLKAAGKRFALFVHLFEPHSTYMEHDGFPITERGTAALEQKYDYEIAYVDGYVGQLLDAIDQQGLRETTAVVLVSDHGEAFGAHRAWGQRMFFHGQTLYDELLRVPLVIRLPGTTARKVEAPVALVDLGPTVTEIMGVPTPASFVGRSLVPAMLGDALPPRPVFAELLPAPSWDHEARAMISGDGRWKLIYRDGGFELYDLVADPGELVDRAAKDADVVEAMKRELTRFIEVDLTR